MPPPPPLRTGCLAASLAKGTAAGALHRTAAEAAAPVSFTPRLAAFVARPLARLASRVARRLSRFASEVPRCTPTAAAAAESSCLDVARCCLDAGLAGRASCCVGAAVPLAVRGGMEPWNDGTGACWGRGCALLCRRGGVAVQSPAQYRCITMRVIHVDGAMLSLLLRH